MPNGKAGDHWYTDIVGERLPRSLSEIDVLVRALDDLAADGKAAAWDNPKRRQIERTVDAHLDRVGYDVLASRGQTIGMEYRNLTPGELAALEADLLRLKRLFQGDIVE